MSARPIAVFALFFAKIMQTYWSDARTIHVGMVLGSRLELSWEATRMVLMWSLHCSTILHNGHASLLSLPPKEIVIFHQPALDITLFFKQR